MITQDINKIIWFILTLMRFQNQAFILKNKGSAKINIFGLLL